MYFIQFWTSVLILHATIKTVVSFPLVSTRRRGTRSNNVPSEAASTQSAQRWSVTTYLHFLLLDKSADKVPQQWVRPVWTECGAVTRWSTKTTVAGKRRIQQATWVPSDWTKVPSVRGTASTLLFAAITAKVCEASSTCLPHLRLYRAETISCYSPEVASFKQWWLDEAASYCFLVPVLLCSNTLLQPKLFLCWEN